MGRISHLPPRRFAEELRAYLWAQIEPEGADASGRWLEARTGGARSRDYWRKITSGAQAMTTNDVEVLAGLFDQSPYDFIRSARRWMLPAGELIEGRFVGGLEDDEAAAARAADPDTGDEQ